MDRKYSKLVTAVSLCETEIKNETIELNEPQTATDSTIYTTKEFKGNDKLDHIFVDIILLKIIYETQIDKIEVIVDGNIYNGQKGIYHKNEGILRILCHSKHDFPKIITFNINNKKEYKTINYTQITHKMRDIPTKDLTDCIEERLLYRGRNIEIYQEHIEIMSSPQYPDERTCISFISEAIDHNFYEIIKDRFVAECTAFDLYDGVGYQIYFCNISNTVYGVSNVTVKESSVFCFSDNYKYSDLYILSNETLFSHQNITEKIWISRRYYFIKDFCLYAQNDQFNIFRSLCFVDHDTYENQITSRITAGIICIILQLLLTLAIVSQVYNNWNIESMFDNDIMIITISFFVFTFLSFLYYNTVSKYYDFYDNMHCVFDISCSIKVFDFISNIVIGLVICLSTFFYLLQSQSIVDVILNSLSLLFVLHLDDKANFFESDEDVLLSNDFANYISAANQHIDIQFKQRRRKIYIESKLWANSICLVLLSPLFIFYALFRIVYGMIAHIKRVKSIQTKCIDDLFD